MPTPEQAAFFGIMGQVGITAFALMFAAVQFSRQFSRQPFQRGDDYLIRITNALLQLMSVTIVSLFFLVQIPGAWRVLALGSGLGSFILTAMLHRLPLRANRSLLSSLPLFLSDICSQMASVAYFLAGAHGLLGLSRLLDLDEVVFLEFASVLAILTACVTIAFVTMDANTLDTIEDSDSPYSLAAGAGVSAQEPIDPRAVKIESPNRSKPKSRAAIRAALGTALFLGAAGLVNYVKHRRGRAK